VGERDEFVIHNIMIWVTYGVVGSEGPHVEIGYRIGFIRILTLPLSYVTALFVL
jgi:hypothetical protein